MKVKREELGQLLQGLSAINVPGTKFNYAVLKNKKKVEAEIKVIKEVMKSSAEYEEFTTKRIEVCEKHCTKNKEGKSIIQNRVYAGLKDNVEFDKELETLKVTYKVALEGYEKQRKELTELLAEEVEIELHQVNVKDVPDGVTTKQLEAIFIIVKE